MKKILFVGKFDVLLRALNNFVDDMFNVQICVDSSQVVKGMLKLKSPDLVVINLIEISNDVEHIFEELKHGYPNTPVICIGYDEDVNRYIDSIDESQFTVLKIPMENDEILEAICSVLNVEEDETEVVENKGEKKSILVVDDSNIQLQVMNELLKEKYEVRKATSGMKALTMIGKKKPDMIFLDYEMPLCDGRMTLEMIRELEESKDIPVVFLTGVSDKEHIAAVLSLKPAGYLLKPADSSLIYNIIEKILG